MSISRAYREHGHGSLFPRAGDSTVSVGLGGSRRRDYAPGRPWQLRQV